MQSQLAAEGILIVDEPRGRTAVTVVLPYQGDRAFVTFDPETPIQTESAVELNPPRVIYTLDQVERLPSAARHFVTVGDREASRYAGRPLPSLPTDATAFLNAAEAVALTGRTDLHDAAQALTSWADTVVITRGGAGAVACERGVLVEAPGIDVEVVDTTGAGDLLAAAWVWGDAQRLDLQRRLQWAVLYAGLSVQASTAAGGAVMLTELLNEGGRRGLTPLRSVRLTETHA